MVQEFGINIFNVCKGISINRLRWEYNLLGKDLPNEILL